MNGTLKISGGKPLKGEVTPIQNKNSLMGALPLAMLDCGGISYHDLPPTSDVEKLLEIYRRFGADVTFSDGDCRIDSSAVNTWSVDHEIGVHLRGAFMFIGPLLARFGQAEVPVPGGCKLGDRSLSCHLEAFKAMDVQITEGVGSITLTVPKKEQKSYSVWLMEASVTATINVASYAFGRNLNVEIIDAACEPHVVDVLNLMVSMGATIEGIGTNIVRIKGREELKPGKLIPSPDHVDIAGYIVAAAVTKGKIRIKGGYIPFVMDGILQWFTRFGVDFRIEGDDLVAIGKGKLEINTHEFPTAGRDLPKFAVRPWPGFPVDVLPVMVTLACKSQGNMLFQNWMYENGFDYIRELNYLGAEIYMSDPQKIIVMEPAVRFKGGEVAAPGIIQGAKAIFLAALADKEETILHGMDILKRRYPDIITNYRHLGASIEKI